MAECDNSHQADVLPAHSVALSPQIYTWLIIHSPEGLQSSRVAACVRACLSWLYLSRFRYSGHRVNDRHVIRISLVSSKGGEDGVTEQLNRQTWLIEQLGERVWVAGKGRPAGLARNRCQTGTCVFNVSSAASFLETQSASTEASQQTAASYLTSVSLWPTFCWDVESQNKKYKKQKAHSLPGWFGKKALWNVLGEVLGKRLSFLAAFLPTGKNTGQA